MSKQYEPGTLGSILEDRLADLLDHGTIDRDQFVWLVLGDMKQDGILCVEESEDEEEAPVARAIMEEQGADATLVLCIKGKEIDIQACGRDKTHDDAIVALGKSIWKDLEKADATLQEEKGS